LHVGELTCDQFGQFSLRFDNNLIVIFKCCAVMGAITLQAEVSRSPFVPVDK